MNQDGESATIGGSKWAGRGGVWLLVALNAVALIHVAHNAALPYPIEPSDGGMLSSAWQVARGGSIYNELTGPPYVFNIHNPLFIYLSALVMKIFGPEPWAVRALGEVMLLGAAYFVYKSVRRLGGSATGAVVAGLLLPVERFVLKRSGLAICDFSALFFSTMGLWLWFSGGRRRYLAVAAFVAAYFGKQSAIIAPVAAFAGLALCGRGGKVREAAFFAGLWVAGLLAGLAAAWGLLGKAYILNTLYYGTVTTFDYAEGVRAIGLAAAFYPLCMVAAVWTAREARYRTVATYIAGGLVLAYASGNEGSSESYLFVLGAGLAMSTGVGWGAFAARLDGERGWRRAAVRTVFVVQGGLLMVGVFYNIVQLWERAEAWSYREARAALYADDEALVLNFTPGYEVGRAGENFSTDPHRLAQILKEGVLLPGDTLVRLAREEAFTAAVVPKSWDARGLFTDELCATLDEYYVAAGENDKEKYLVPRGPQR